MCPPSTFFAISFATAPDLEVLFHDFCPSSLAHILIHHFFNSDVPLRSHMTFYGHMSGQKVTNFVYFFTKPMENSGLCHFLQNCCNFIFLSIKNQ